MEKNGLDVPELERWLWKAACKLRGPVDAPKYKDYILPIIFIKRLSDVFNDELNKLAKDYKDKETAEKFLEKDHKLVRFYLPEEARWENISKQSKNLGEYLTDATRAIARENSKLDGVINRIDFNKTESGQRVLTDDNLKTLIDILGEHRLGLDDVEPDIIGRAYEYLLRKFAEGSGSSAGEFYTPKEVAILMARILDPKPGQEVYDPACGSAGLLIKSYLRFKEKYGEDSSVKPLKFYGQEILSETFVMAKMNVFIHFIEAAIELGDTMNKPRFTNPDSSLRKFDIVTANPKWNQDFDSKTYTSDKFDRFGFGYPPSSSADWGWIQHMFASLNDKGKMAVVLDTGAVSRGSGNVGKNRERDIKKEFVENDFVEAVILLPENLFYNTTAPGVILIINKVKGNKDDILLINASKLFKKGRPKNYLPEDAIKKVSDAYLNWKEEDGISKVIKVVEVAKNDYNLSPSRYLSTNDIDETLPLEDVLVLLQEAEEERQEADEKLKEILGEMGMEL